MILRLLKPVLISSFAGGSTLGKALITIAGCAVVLAGLGTGFARALWNQELPPDLPHSWIASGVSLSSFLLGSVLTIAIMTAQTGSRFARLFSILQTLPIPFFLLWLLRLLPLAITTFLIGLFCAPLALALSHASAVPVSALFAACLLGLLSSLGFVLLPIHLAFKASLLISISYIGVKLLEYGILHFQTPKYALATLVLNLLIVSGSTGYILSFLHQPLTIAYDTRERLSLPASTIHHLWFSLKIIRNTSSRTNVLSLLLISFFLAYTAYTKHLIPTSQQYWLTVAALITGTLASTIRILTRPAHTPELHLHDIRYFVASQLKATALTCFLLILPLTAVILLDTPPAPLLFSQLAALYLGLLVTAFLCPRATDIGSQILAVSLATAAIYGSSHFLKAIPLPGLALLFMALAWIAFCHQTIISIESNRNRHA